MSCLSDHRRLSPRYGRTRRYVKGRSHLSKDAMQRKDEFFVPAPGAATCADDETPGQKASDLGFQRSPLSDSNRRPTHYKCVALAS